MRSILIFLCLILNYSILLSQAVIPTPSQSDQIIIDAGVPGAADPNDRIRYIVTIQNTGTDSATMVQLNAMLDPNTTLVPGSFRTSPMAANDNYAVTGNVGISVSAPGVKSNDFDDALGAATLSCGSCMSANGGTVTINNNGSFTYVPPAGFTGSDMFTYTMTDSNPVGAPVPATDNGTVFLNVANLIYFIDNSSMAATSDGRLSSPYKSLADFNAGSTAAGNVIYLAHTGVNYTNGIQLAANERLFGEGHTGGTNLADVLPFTLAPNSFPLPPINGSRPVITNAGGHGITLALNNHIRGLEVDATSLSKIFGGGPFGTLTVGNNTNPDVLLSGAGQAISLSGGSFDATSGFISVTSTSSAAQGVLIQNVGGTADFGNTTISGSTTQGILMSASTATIDFGNTSVTGGTDQISLQNNSSGTRTFGTITTLNGTGTAFLHAVGGGLTNVTGATSITNPGTRGIDIQDNTVGNGVTFANVSVTQSGGTGVFLEDNAGVVTFADLDITPDANQRALHANNNTGTITATSGTISNTGATGIEITRASGATPINIVLTSVTTNGGTNGILLNNTTGTFNGGSGTLASSTATGFQIQNGTAVITYSGNITSSGTFAVSIDNHETNNITFQTGNITNSGSGINVINSNSGTIAFDNPTITLSVASSNEGVNLSTNSGGAINFSGGNLDITTVSGIGFDATGGGTITVTGSGNTIRTISNSPLNVVNTTIGANDLTFESISAGNNDAATDPANGIILNTTGSLGGLTVTGTGTTDGSGGLIRNIQNRGTSIISAIDISLSNMTYTNANMVDASPCGSADNSGCNAAIHINTVTNVNLTNIDINGTVQQGINLKEVIDFDLLNSTITATGTGSQPEEGGLYVLNLSGIASISNTSITFPGGRSAAFFNTSKTLDIDVMGSSFNDSQTSAVGADGFEFSAFGTSNTTMDISNSNFLRNKTNGIQILSQGSSTGSFDIVSNIIDYDGFAGGGAGIDFASAGTANVDFNIMDHLQIEGALISIVNIFADDNSTMEGRVNNNIITSGGGSGTGIRVLGQEDADIVIEIDGNTVTGITLDNGINVESRLGTGRVDAIVSDNTISVAAGANSSIRSAAGNSGSAFTNKTCAWVKTNNVTLGAGFSDHEGRVVNAHELILQGGGASMAANWNNNSNIPISPPAIMNPLISGAGMITFAGTCTAPANPLP